jgi:hypothetical protein
MPEPTQTPINPNTLPSGILVVGQLLAALPRTGTKTDGGTFETVTASILTGTRVTYVSMDPKDTTRLCGVEAPFRADGQAPVRVAIPCWARPYKASNGTIGIDFKANRADGRD